MAKPVRRKPAKKTHPKPKASPRAKAQLDDEMTELATLLDECRLDNTADGWFSVPWRDGWNAVGLAYSMWNSTLDEAMSLDMTALELFSLTLVQVLNGRTPVLTTGETYAKVTEMIQGMPMRGMLYAALRCMQVHVANSSGGGVVFNDLLLAAMRDEVPDHIHEQLVLEYRCRDAIGAPRQDDNRWPKQRRAFALAWQRGLFMTAYNVGTMR